MERCDLCGDVYNVGNSEPVTIEELARKIIARTGSASEITYVPYEHAYGAGYEDLLHRAPDLSKIHAAIGYVPQTSLDELLDAVIEYMRKSEGLAD
jgi:UDP-glucose 4-epimerase